MSNKILAGLVAGIPLAIILGVYVIVRGKALVAFFQSTEESIQNMSENTLFYIILACFIGAGLVFGTLSGVIYNWVGTATTFRWIAIGATIVLSILALVSKQPLKGDKVTWNIAVGVVLGLLVPLIA